MITRMKKQRPQLIGLVVFGILGLGGIGFWLWNGQSAVRYERENDLKPSVIAPADCPYRSTLNGVCVSDLVSANQPVVAVMVENHVAARPQSGLAAASVVYEVPVEANYTRFLTLFPLNAVVQKVGPVRSARPYFLDWVAEWSRPLYAHVGGSPEALEIIKSRGVFDLNEMYRGWYFWRSTDRSAPHNTYISSDLWQKAWADYRGGTEPAKTKWVFATTTAWCTSDCVNTLKVDFLPPAYAAEWRYSTSTGRYGRWQIEGKHLDQDGVTQIKADTIVVQKVQETVTDEVGRLEIGTIGSGEALVFTQGRVQIGRWRKNSVDAQTEWVNEVGAPLVLSPGKIWLEIVPQTGRVRYE